MNTGGTILSEAGVIESDNYSRNSHVLRDGKCSLVKYSDAVGVWKLHSGERNILWEYNGDVSPSP